MRKTFGLLAAAVFFTAVAAAGNAYAIGVGNSTHTATVTLTGGEFSWDVNLRYISNNAQATQIQWNTSAITLGTTKWADSTVYAVLTSTITDSSAKIQLYTRNKEGTNYKYYGSTITASGLVKQVLGSTSSVTLPFAFRVSTSAAPGHATAAPDLSDGNNGVNATTIVFPYSLNTTPKGYFAGGLYMTDSAADNFGTTSENPADVAYRTILSEEGYRYGGGVDEMGDSPSGTFYIFFGANFGSAMGGNTYGSDTITFHGFKE